MTENTPSNKAQFFATYWLQFNEDNHGSKNIWNGLSDISGCRLLLAPLSSITDEDAVEVTKLILQQSDKYLFSVERIRKKTISVKYPFMVVKALPNDRKNNEMNRLVKFSLNEFRFSFVKAITVHNTTSKWIETWESNIFPESISCVIDYLRSRGYLIQWRDLTPDQLVSYGWVKVKTI